MNKSSVNSSIDIVQEKIQKTDAVLDKVKINDDFLQKDGSSVVESPAGLELVRKRKELVNKIILSLGIPGEIYNPEATVKAIQGYFANEKELVRILYSQITMSIFASDETTKSNIDNNFQLLIDYVSRLENIGDQRKLMDFVLRIYDHVQLAEAQQKVIDDAKELAAKQIVKSVEKTKQDALIEVGQKLNDEARTSQRGYVATLGIFASIMVAIFGNLSLSRSIVAGFNNNLFSLILLSTLAGTFVIIIIHMLLAAVGSMLDKKIESLESGTYILAFWTLAFICFLVLAKIE